MHIALYVRVSTQRQAQQQTSEQQLARLRAWCAERKEEVEDELVFRDDGFSGASLRRPGLDALRDAAASARCALVVLTAPDRLARNYVHQMVLLEEFERAGCRVEFLDRPMSQDPHDQLVLQIRGAVAEYERTLITERMRRGRLHKLQAGVLLPWTVPPYGYRLGLEHPRDPAGVWVEPAEGALIQEIFTCYLLLGSSLDGVAKWLMAAGVPTPTGKTIWYGSTLRGILQNPAYTGRVYAGRTTRRPCRRRYSALRPVSPGMTSQEKTPPATWISVATIPALVSEVQFDQVQAKLAQNQQTAARHNSVNTYLLRALVSCGHCRQACTGRCAHPDYPYYVCNGKMPPLRSSRTEKCPARFTPARQLDALVWQDLCEILMHPESLKQALEQAHGGHWLPQHLQARRAQLRQGQARVRNQVDRLTDAYLNQIMPLPEYQRRRQALEHHLQALARQDDQLAAEAQRQQDVAEVLQSVDVFCARVQAGLTQATWEQKRQLVELLIDRVVVTDSDVEIHYVIPTTPASEQVRFCHLQTDYFHAALLFVGQDELLVGELGEIEHIGRDQEGRLASCLLSDHLLVHAHRRRNPPLHPVRLRVCTGEPRPSVFGHGAHVRLDNQPCGTLLQLLVERRSGIWLTGEATVAQMPQRVFPLLARALDLALQGGASTLLARRCAHHDPALSPGRDRHWCPEPRSPHAARRRQTPPAPPAPASTCPARD
jgi:site-specific DNA recombinase